MLSANDSLRVVLPDAERAKGREDKAASVEKELQKLRKTRTARIRDHAQSAKQRAIDVIRTDYIREAVNKAIVLPPTVRFPGEAVCGLTLRTYA